MQPVQAVKAYRMPPFAFLAADPALTSSALPRLPNTSSTIQACWSVYLAYTVWSTARAASRNDLTEAATGVVLAAEARPG